MRFWNPLARCGVEQGMKRFMAMCLVFAAALAPHGSAAQGDLLARMSAVDANLHSYTATMKAHVALSTFPFLSTDVRGTYYHKDPDLNKLEITSGLPGVAQQFGKLYPHIEPPSRWPGLFIVTQVSSDGTTAHFKLVPRKPGNVESIDATVDEKSATVSSMRWYYANGGSAEMNNRYSTVKGFLVITSQTGNVDEPSYKGTISSTLSNYVMNPSIPDTVFQQGR